MKILNNREWQLDFSEGKFRKFRKFKLSDPKIIDLLLENFYDYCGLSNLQRLKRKLRIRKKELIIAIIYAFKCQ